MKNKLAKIFGLLLAGATALGVAGCGGKGDGSSTSDSGDMPAVKTVTAEGFKTAIEKVINAEEYTATIDGEMRNGVVSTIKKDGNLLYVSPVYVHDEKGALTAYIQYDDATLSATMYSFYANAPDVWEKDTGTSSTAESFAEEKASMGLAANVGLDYLYSTSDGGETVALGDLYSSFTYNETTEKYEGNVFMYDTRWDSATQQDVEEYNEVTLSFDFADGDLVGFTLTLGGNSLVAAIAYEATVTIPQAALDAQESGGNQGDGNQENGGNQEGDGDTPAIKTVDEEAFIAAFENLNSAEKYTAVIQGLFEDDKDMILQRDGDIIYRDPIGKSGNDYISGYMVFDDKNLTMTTYMHAASQPDKWNKFTDTETDENEYEERKFECGVVYTVGLDYFYSVEDEGVLSAIYRLYDEFTFDADKNVYSAQLYAYVDMGGSNAYQAITVSFEFEDGVLVGITMDWEEYAMTVSLTYGETLTIPDAALNAQ